MFLLNYAFHNFYHKNYKDLIDSAQELHHDGHKIINLSPHLIFPQGDFLNKEPAHFLDDLIQSDGSVLNQNINNDPYHFLCSIEEKASSSYYILFSLAELMLDADDEMILLPGYDAKLNALADKNKILIKCPTPLEQKSFDFDNLRYLINSRTKWIILDHATYSYRNASSSFLKDLAEYLLDYPHTFILDLLDFENLQNNVCISKIEPRLTFRNIIFHPREHLKETIHLPQRLFEFLYFFGFESLSNKHKTTSSNIKKASQLLPKHTYQLSKSSDLLFIKKSHLKFYNDSSSFCEKEFLHTLLSETSILVDEGSRYGMHQYIALGLSHDPLLFEKHLPSLVI